MGTEKAKPREAGGPLFTAIPHHSSDKWQFYLGDLLQEDRGGIARQD